MIGNDLLPNAYVDRINLYDGVFEISAYCVDSIESPSWSRHNLSMKYFKIMVVSTESTALITDFKFGVIKMDPKQILNRDPAAVITSYPIKNANQVTNKGFTNFKIKAKHSYSGSGELNVFVAVVVDPVQIAGSKYTTESYISGPVISEKILTGGGINPFSNAWVLPDGTQWVGPVHRHPTKGYMQFSSHSDQEHEPVTLTQFRNIKVNDLRKQQSFANPASSVTNDITEVSQLFNSFGTEGQNNSIFFLNMKQIVAKNTKFGSVFLSLSPEYHKQIINDMNFRLVNVERQMVRTAFVNNKMKINKILQTKNILSAFEQGQSFVVTRGQNAIRKTVFPFDEEIRAFEFTDTEANVNLSGQFQYNVTLYFRDPTIAQSQAILDDLANASKVVNAYLGRIVRNLKTNEERNNPPESWISSEDAIYSADITEAPWIYAPKIYAKYKKMFFNTDSSFDKIEFDSYNMLSPRSFSMNSINTFIDRLKTLVSHVNKTFNVKTTTISNFSDLSMPKNSYVSNLIEKKFHFTKIVEPSKNKKYYNVLESSEGQQFTKRITLSDFKSRVKTEFDKFFDGDENSQSDKIETNLEISMASYFSPLTMSDFGGDKIDLSDLTNVDKEKFNGFFDNIPKPRLRTKRRPTRKQKFNIRPRMISIEKENYIEASEYLGGDSNFLTAEEREDFKSIKKASTKTINNLSNKLTKPKSKSKNKIKSTKANNIFKPAFVNRAPSTISGRTLIPNQFRSYNVGLVSNAKNIFSEQEIEAAENELLVSVNYLNLTQIESLVDFETSPDGIKIMNSPIWQIVTAEQVDELSVGVLCRMETIKSPVSNMEMDTRTELPFSDKYFIISDSELAGSTPIGVVEEDTTVSENYLNSKEFDISGVSSEILEQNLSTEEQIFKVKIEEFQTTTVAAPTRTVSRPRATPAPARTSRTVSRPARRSGGSRGGGGY